MASYVSALISFIADLSFMWSDDEMFNILIYKLLLVVLCVYLVPTREKEHQELLKSMIKFSTERKDEVV